MANIDLTAVSKEELIKMWEEANRKVNLTNMTQREKFNTYLDWLEEPANFDTELMMDLAREISTSMCAIYAKGESYEYYNEETDTFETRKYTVDYDNPDIEDLYRFAVIEGLMKDDEYLKEYYITKKKPTKKLIYSFYDIDWDAFTYETFIKKNS